MLHILDSELPVNIDVQASPLLLPSRGGQAPRKLAMATPNSGLVTELI
jgi:hypothetical protein